MSYTVLARKYRPQTFADLVGQEHVSRTIGNAIGSGRVAHAFLFTGARGVGKTTTARLLAKALNCEKGPTAEPCNVCDACKEITTGNDLDVLEIDGASNNSVDDVRRLQETLPFRPARDRFKVVIVDEVHMLSTGAFNAFLKTLEEPPAHVKFIFATTEVHKVPITIRSRCQRYDFRLIPHNVVAARVREILQREQIDADDAAIAVVAREAAGSMRDALTVLDQLLALGHGGGQGGDNTLHGEEVARGLGIASRKHVFSVIESLLDGDAAACLRSVHDVAQQGLDVLHFARQLLECARDLVVFRVVGDDRELIDLVDDERDAAKRIADAKSKEELERVFAGLSKLVDEVGRAGTPQVTLEMGLVRLADRPALLPLRELVDRLRALEEKLGTGAGPRGPAPGSVAGGGGPAAGGSGDRRFAPPGQRGPTPGSAPTRAEAAPKEAPHAEAAPREAAPLKAAPVTAAPARTDAPYKREPTQKAAFAIPAHLTEPVVTAKPTTPTAPASPSTVAAEPPPSAAATPTAPVHAAAPAASAEPTFLASPAFAAKNGSASHEASASNGSSGTDVLGSAPPALWIELVSQLKAAQPALGAVLEHGSPLEVSATTLRIGFPESSFFGRQAQSAAARESILKMAEVVLGARPELLFGAVPPGDGRIATLSELDEAARKTRKAEQRAAALAHPSVRDALEVFEETESSVQVETE